MGALTRALHRCLPRRMPSWKQPRLRRRPTLEMEAGGVVLPCLAEQVLGGVVKAVILEAAKEGEKWREVERSGEDKAQSKSVEEGGRS